VRTRLWQFHLGGGCALALAYVYLPYPALRIGAMALLCLATIAATLAAVRLWRPAWREPFRFFAAGAFGSSAAVTRAGGSVAAAALTCVAYLIGIVGYALLIRTRSPGRTRAYLLMTAGWLVLVAADAGRALLVLLGTYDPSSRRWPPSPTWPLPASSPSGSSPPWPRPSPWSAAR
jgi:hypothetical protein